MTHTSTAAWSYRRGDWFGIFGSDAAVLLPPSEKGRVAELWELADAGAGFDELLDALVAGGLRGLPGFALVSSGAEPTRVLLRGATRATIGLRDGSTVELDGGSAATWVERTLEGVEAMLLEVSEVAAGGDLPIDGGLVRVARVDQPPYAGATQEPTAEPAVPAAEPVPIADSFADLVTEPVEVVAGVPGTDRPEAPAWAQPGTPFLPPPPPPMAPAPMAPAPPVPQAGAGDVDHGGQTVAGGSDPNRFARQQPGIPGQPQAPSVTAAPVARLVFSNGETVVVDRAVLVGRAPEARRFTSTEQPRLVTVPSPHQEISSTHLEVRPGSGADLGCAVVTDLGSTNGTVLQLPGLAPADLQPGIAVQLVPGSEIDLGDGVTIQVTHP